MAHTVKEEKTLGKPVSASAVNDSPRLLAPCDLNGYGIAFGGKILSVADELAGIVARRHSERTCVTAFIDFCQFLAPAYQGEELIFKAAVNRVWKTSLEIGVKVLARNHESSGVRHVLSMYFTFVALGEDRGPIEVLPVIPETPDELRRFEEAELRRAKRFEIAGKNGKKS